MKTHTVLTIILFLLVAHMHAKNENDSLLNVLDNTLSDRSIYMDQKEKKIEKLKRQYTNSLSIKEEYELNNKIIDEYWSYICDSALYYINRNIDIAKQSKNNEWLIESKTQSSFVLASSGLFVEAIDMLSSIDRANVSDNILKEYYKSHQRLYSNMAKYIDDKNYSTKYYSISKKYRDSIIMAPSENLIDSEFELWLQKAEEGESDAPQQLSDLLLKMNPDIHQYAMNSDRLSTIYANLKDTEQQEKYLILAAITDIKLAVKENEALLKLAILINQRGDANRAYKYTQISFEDANFYNTRFRNSIIGKVQPITEKSYLLKIEQQSKNLKTYAIIISILVIGLCITTFFVYKQARMASHAKSKLKKINDNLQNLNKKLDDTNHIKEEYIGYFLNQCSLYIDKLDEYRKLINRKISTGQLDDVFKLTSSSRNIDKDVEELYQNFDNAFLRIFPNFVGDFNTLLREEEQYIVKSGELNTELRIFALIRLGITDSNQISAFLRYSLRTIYNYRSKVKAKAKIENDNFEEKVKLIGLF